jgi:hypothetical protein
LELTPPTTISSSLKLTTPMACIFKWTMPVLRKIHRRVLKVGWCIHPFY